MFTLFRTTHKTAFALSTILVVLLFLSTTPSLFPVSPPNSLLLSPSQSNKTPSSSPCSLSQLSLGHWVPKKDPLLALEDLMGDDAECEGGEERALSVGNWEWITDGECGRHGRWEFEEEEAIGALLAMQEGLIVVGVSLGDQFTHAMRTLLDTPTQSLLVGKIVDSSVRPDTNAPVALHKTYSLNPFHPLYAHLEGMVGRERMARPVLQYVRSHHLVDEEWIVAHVQASEGGQGGVRRNDRVWPFERDHLWLEVVDDLIAKGEESGRGTTVVLNTGPHWNAPKFVGVDPADSNQIMLATMKDLVPHVLLSLPRSPLLSFILRSSNPGTASCSSSLSSPLLLSTSSPDAPLYLAEKRWNFEVLPQFDEVWKKEMEAFAQSGGLEEGKAQVEFWDYRKMMGLRPEAKKAPGKGDCLHFCIPALLEPCRLLMQHLVELAPPFSDFASHSSVEKITTILEDDGEAERNGVDPVIEAKEEEEEEHSVVLQELQDGKSGQEVLDTEE